MDEQFPVPMIEIEMRVKRGDEQKSVTSSRNLFMVESGVHEDEAEALFHFMLLTLPVGTLQILAEKLAEWWGKDLNTK